MENMNSDEIIFTSYCFANAAAGGDYVAQQERLKKSILEIYPDANLHIYNEPEEIGKPKFQQSLYGYKVHLVNDCLKKGFKKIIYFDAAITLNDNIDYWFEIIESYGILTIKDNQTLNNVTSDNCLNWYHIEREAISKVNLCGGSVYVFDFNLPLCQYIFHTWAEMEAYGFFGTQDDLSNNRLQNHRMDETCMALALWQYDVKPLEHRDMRYAYLHHETGKLVGGNYKPIIIKKHFK